LAPCQGKREWCSMRRTHSWTGTSQHANHPAALRRSRETPVSMSSESEAAQGRREDAFHILQDTSLPAGAAVRPVDGVVSLRPVRLSSLPLSDPGLAQEGTEGSVQRQPVTSFSRRRFVTAASDSDSPTARHPTQVRHTMLHHVTPSRLVHYTQAQTCERSAPMSG
jgi:hypothetical protein